MSWSPDAAVTIVTGASSGIGWALATILLDRGATVIVNARRGERLDPLRDQYGQQVVPVAGDLTTPAVRDQVVAAARTAGNGRLDLLVNNAGIGAIGPFADASPERLRRIMEVNFFAPVELTRLLVPLLRRGRDPVICNVSSVLGHCAVPDKSEYCASKFALHGWSDALRCELAVDGIQVTLVSPSTTRSEFFDSLIDSATATTNRIGSWSPERVARVAFAAICRRRHEVICSLPGKALVYADRLSPPLIGRILAK